MFWPLRFVFFSIFSLSRLFAIVLPQIEPQDVTETLGRISSSHVTHKKLSPLLIQRGIETFLELIDPTKTYLLADEVAPYLSLSPQKLQKIVAEAENSDFRIFREIHALMQEAIARRGKLDASMKHETRPKDVSPKEFRDLAWAKDLENLKTRILRIEGLQRAATAMLTQESTEKAMARIFKKRALLEKSLTDENLNKKERFFLTLTLRALASAFDAHTTYFTPAEASQFMVQVQQRLFGIGAQLRDDLNGFTIMKIIEAGPASFSDLKVQDRVIAIGGEPVVGLDITDAVELIRGEAGTKIVLTVLREGSEGEKRVDVEITRGEVVLKEARLASTLLPFGDGMIAVLRLHSFYQDSEYSSAKDLREKILEIKKTEKLKGLILDLRHNYGGLLPQAVAVSGLFITKGIVVSIKDNKGHVEHLREVDGKTTFDGPLIILTSKASASAAEIVAQTLQDYGRAIVVGDEHTYGKGTFQTFTLDQSRSAKVNHKGEYKVTRGRYYTVSGKSPQLVGVSPDIIIPGPYSSLEIGERHAKNPLQNDSIAPNFEDDLSDVPPFQREQITWFYRFNLQQRLTTFAKHLPSLKKNAAIRMSGQQLYQAYLEELRSEEINRTALEMYSVHDFQLEETVNVLKDLILLCS